MDGGKIIQDSDPRPGQKSSSLDLIRIRNIAKYGVRPPKFIWAPGVQLYSLAETPQLPPSPVYGLIYEGASQDRRHLFL